VVVAAVVVVVAAWAAAWAVDEDKRSHSDDCWQPLLQAMQHTYGLSHVDSSPVNPISLLRKAYNVGVFELTISMLVPHLLSINCAIQVNLIQHASHHLGQGIKRRHLRL
jgi:hypothetical protein